MKFWNPGTTPAGIPVIRIALRSARGFLYAARFGNAPGYSAGSSPPSSGLLTYFVYCASLLGGREFHWSFSAIGVMTSLNSGLPRRETCFHGPRPTYLPVLES